MGARRVGQGLSSSHAARRQSHFRVIVSDAVINREPIRLALPNGRERDATIRPDHAAEIALRYAQATGVGQVAVRQSSPWGSRVTEFQDGIAGTEQWRRER